HAVSLEWSRGSWGVRWDIVHPRVGGLLQGRRAEPFEVAYSGFITGGLNRRSERASSLTSGQQTSKTTALSLIVLGSGLPRLRGGRTTSRRAERSSTTFSCSSARSWPTLAWSLRSTDRSGSTRLRPCLCSRVRRMVEPWLTGLWNPWDFGGGASPTNESSVCKPRLDDRSCRCGRAHVPMSGCLEPGPSTVATEPIGAVPRMERTTRSTRGRTSDSRIAEP